MVGIKGLNNMIQVVGITFEFRTGMELDGVTAFDQTADNNPPKEDCQHLLHLGSSSRSSSSSRGRG